MTQKPWLALIIGNSRLHWAGFVGTQFQVAWNTAHLKADTISQLVTCQFDIAVCAQIFPVEAQAFLGHKVTNSSLPLWLASVVPEQTFHWQNYPNIHILTPEQIPLQGTYPTLGIDRLLALWGAGQKWGFPILVIDAGTALTFTSADPAKCFRGGAILPGLSTQFMALRQQTAQLPQLTPQQFRLLPDRWAFNTADAIASGVIYSLLSGIRDFGEDWLQRYPGSAIAFTGGDADLIMGWLTIEYPDLTKRIYLDSHLIFRGVQACYLSSIRLGKGW
jgi:type III pantothenate kinase